MEGKPDNGLENVTADDMLAQVQPMLKPFELDYKVCDWSSVYTVMVPVLPEIYLASDLFLTFLGRTKASEKLSIQR